MVAYSCSHNSEFDEKMDPRNHSGRNKNTMMSTFSTNADDHNSQCSIEETETILCEEKYPTLTSEGQSLKLSTRNFPLRSAFNENGDNVTKANNAEHISELYTKTGQTLSSPQALAGLLNLSALFTNKASQLPHIYKSKLYQMTFVFSVGMFMVFFPLYLIHSENDSDFEIWLLIPMVGPLMLFACGSVFWTFLPACTKTLQLRSKLESIESFLSLCELSNEEFDQLFYEEDHGICDYKVVGSAGDGFGFFASQGSNKQPLEEKAILTQDIDLNIFINTLSIKDEHLMRVPGAPGFTWIVLNADEVMNVHDPVIKNSLFNSSEAKQFFLSAAGISHIASRYFKGTDTVNAQIIEHFPALTLHTTAVGPNGNQDYEVDYAFALRCPHWPSEASEWVTRSRAGIDENTVTAIASRGCYLVHKPCGKEEIQHNHEFDWRFTFASAEADLFHYHSDKKALKLAYVILKFLIKISAKPKGILESSLTICDAIKLAKGSKEMPVLRTYHLKTVFLWMAEQETTLDMYSIQGNKDLGKVFMGLLNRYYECVKEKNLPNYFMRDRNMLAGSRYQEIDFKKAMKLLNVIRTRPTYNIVLNFERQFINKKTVIGVVVFSLVSLSAMYLLQDITDIWSYTANAIAEVDITNGLNDDSRFFTVKYLNYLNQLYLW